MLLEFVNILLSFQFRCSNPIAKQREVSFKTTNTLVNNSSTAGLSKNVDEIGIHATLSILKLHPLIINDFHWYKLTHINQNYFTERVDSTVSEGEDNVFHESERCAKNIISGSKIIIVRSKLSTTETNSINKIEPEKDSLSPSVCLRKSSGNII